MEEYESKDNIKNSDPNNHDTMSEQGKEYIWELVEHTTQNTISIITILKKHQNILLHSKIMN